MDRANASQDRSLGSARPLTRREQQVLALMTSGQSTKEMAQSLGLSPRTVDVHVGAIMAKTGVRKRVQAVALSLRARDANAAPGRNG
jgi:DNA-binding CsgD family transcriptional regulator